MSKENKAQEKASEYTDLAFAVAKKDDKWSAFVLEFDPKTGVARIKETHTEDSKSGAVQRFKILVGSSNTLD